jgi:hypothetical protein
MHDFKRLLQPFATNRFKMNVDFLLDSTPLGIETVLNLKFVILF